MILDNFGRPINYVRIAVTDRCNLRCFYCMPANGIPYVPRAELLSYEEIERLVTVLASMGINKVRITGGEPFLRKNLIEFVERLNRIKGIEGIHITTNGVLTTPFIPKFREIGIKSVNLSLDTLDRERFKMITRRDELDKVLKCLDTLLEYEISTKINAVVMDDKNTDDILPMVALTEKMPVGVRFIEEMPFNGSGHHQGINWNHTKILSTIEEKYPQLIKLKDEKHATSVNYRVAGHVGSFGIIPAFSRTFCGSCNRIRITPVGTLKTCLYDDGVWNIRDTMRAGATNEELTAHFLKACGSRAKNGFEAQKKRRENPSVSESMATIGG